MRTGHGSTPRARPRRPLSLLAALAFVACGQPIGSVGAVLAKNGASGSVYVRQVDPVMTGARAGLEPGDELLAIDGHDVRDLSPLQLHQALRGPVGSTVVLTAVHRGHVERLAVVRGPYRPPSAPASPSASAPTAGLSHGT